MAEGIAFESGIRTNQRSSSSPAMFIIAQVARQVGATIGLLSVAAFTRLKTQSWSGDANAFPPFGPANGLSSRGAATFACGSLQCRTNHKPAAAGTVQECGRSLRLG